MNRFFSLACAVLAITSIAGCASFATLNSAATPTDLYALTPKSTFSTNLPRIKSQLVIEEPTATAAVDTDRIAVQPNPLQVQYLPRARWVDRAPLIVQALLIESYENSGKVESVGRSAVGLRAEYALVPELREFQAFAKEDAAGTEYLEVIVRLNIKIVDADLDQIIASRSFEERVPSASEKALDIVTAFDEALGDAMRDAVEWSVREIYADR